MDPASRDVARCFTFIQICTPQHSFSTPLERSISVLFPDSVLSSPSSVYTFSRSISFSFQILFCLFLLLCIHFSCIMYMASSSSSSFTFTKVDLPVRYLQRIRKNLLPPSLSRKSLLSYRTPTVYLPHVYRTATATVSRLDDHVVNDPTKHDTPQLEVHSSTWNWRGFSIRYQHSGNSGPALVLVHGFGANSDHWRKNIPVLARSHRVFSIDLIGYGYSDKPNPREYEEPFYTFDTWATQLNEFCIDVVKDKAYFICNSIGGVVGLQAAVIEPETCMGIMLLNISLRMLHTNKQPWYGRPLIRLFQNLLRNTALGNLFYKSVAKPDSIRSILSQVTDELVQAILLPGLQPGAADVFLEFICYSGGPLPEELLPLVKCPVLIAWGDKDPWEPIELGRTFVKFDSVEDFIVLPNVGHCPQDEAPHLVNQLIGSFVAHHAKTQASLSPKII